MLPRPVFVHLKRSSFGRPLPVMTALCLSPASARQPKQRRPSPRNAPVEPFDEWGTRLVEDRARPRRGLHATARALEDLPCRRVAVLGYPAVRAHEAIGPTAGGRTASHLMRLRSS